MTDLEFIDYVDTLTNDERIKLREELKAQNDKRYLARNLHYNYNTQEWI